MRVSRLPNRPGLFTCLQSRLVHSRGLSPLIDLAPCVSIPAKG